MTTVTWILIGTVWCVAWLAIASRRCSRHKDDTAAAVKELGSLLPAFVGASGLIAFLVIPAFARVPLSVTLWAHHAGFISLGAFLLAGQALQLEGWIKLRANQPVKSLRATYTRLWWLTELLPAPIAIGILLSGVGGIAQNAALNPNAVSYSLRSGWLFFMVLGFGIFFWDGILGYRPAVRQMRAYWNAIEDDDAPSAAYGAAFANSTRDALLLVHLMSFPIVLLFGVVRLPQAHWLAPAIEGAERWLEFLPAGMPQAAIALATWGCAGIVIYLARRRG